LEKAVERWLQRAELAVRSGDDTLARAALIKKKQAVEERQSTETLRVEQRSHVLEMKSDLQRMERTLKEFEGRKGTIAVRAQQARAGGGVESLGATGTKTAFDDFRELEERIDGVDAVFEAQREVDEALGSRVLADDVLEAKFAALEESGAPRDGTAGVDDELASLKKRVRV